MKLREWSPPLGLVIQPGCLLVPGRMGYVPEAFADLPWPQRFAVEHDERWVRFDRRWVIPGRPGTVGGEGGPSLAPVSVANWYLSSLNEAELDSLQVAIDAQRQAGIGTRVPATRAEQLILERAREYEPPSVSAEVVVKRGKSE